jgi:hypothetical protein
LPIRVSLRNYLAEIPDWTAAVLNRVERPSFFVKFEEAHAVQYFYEPFFKPSTPNSASGSADFAAVCVSDCLRACT